MRFCFVVSALIMSILAGGCFSFPESPTLCTASDEPTRLCHYTAQHHDFTGEQKCDAKTGQWGQCVPLSLPEPDAGSGGTSGTGGSENPDSELAVLAPVDQANGTELTQSAQMIAMFKVNFAALGNQTVDGIKFTRFGIGPATDISKVMVYNDQLAWLPCTFDDQTSVADCSDLNYTVPNGTMGYAVVYVNFANATTTAQHGWELENASDVTLTGSGQVTGSFPVKGNPFTITNQP